MVTRRPMWDGGVLVQRSPSLANLHPALVLTLNPADVRRLGDGRAGEAEPIETVRVSSRSGSLVVPLRVDAGVAEGSALLPFNLPGGGAGDLVEAGAPYTEVVVEAMGRGR